MDSVTGKLGLVETRLNALEGEAQVGRAALDAIPNSELDEPLFHNVGGTRPKHRRIQQLGSDIEILDSDSDAKTTERKKKAEKKASHAVKVMSKDYMQKNCKAADRTTVERKPRMGAETLTMGEAGLLSQQNIEDLGQITLGMVQPPLQQWQVEPKLGSQRVEETGQRDLLEFLNTDTGGPSNMALKPEVWGNNNLITA